MDLDSFLVSLYVLVDDWWKLNRSSERPKIGRPALLTDSEVITLAFPQPSSGPASAARGTSGVSLGRTCAPLLPEPLLPEPVQSTHPSPGARDARSATRICPRTRRTFVGLPRRGHDARPGDGAGEGFSQGALLLRAGELREERLQDLRWVYGFKVALVVDPEGVVSAFGLAPAASDERPIGDALIASDRYGAYLAYPRASRASSGSGAGWKFTERSLRPRRRTTPAGHGRRPIAYELPASARS
jgi:hypothetical protein